MRMVVNDFWHDHVNEMQCSITPLSVYIFVLISFSPLWPDFSKTRTKINQEKENHLDFSNGSDSSISFWQNIRWALDFPLSLAINLNVIFLFSSFVYLHWFSFFVLYLKIIFYFRKLKFILVVRLVEYRIFWCW